MLKKIVVVQAFIIVLLIVLLATSGDFPYAANKRVQFFRDWVTARTVPFLMEGRIGMTPAAGMCTAPLIYATDSAVYGLIAHHCVSKDDDFIPEKFSVLGEEVLLLDYHAAPNEVRIWRGSSKITPLRGKLVEIASGWDVGMETYVMGLRRGSASGRMDAFYTTGYIQTAPGVTLRMYGDLATSAAAIPGFSGGGVYLYNERANRFELLGIVVAVTIYSNFTFVYSVPREVYDVIARDVAAPAPAKPAPPAAERSRFANWEALSSDVRAEWEKLYLANERYTIKPFDGIEAGGKMWVLGPDRAVYRAWLGNRLSALGRLQEVDWREFILLAVHPTSS